MKSGSFLSFSLLPLNWKLTNLERLTDQRAPWGSSFLFPPTLELQICTTCLALCMGAEDLNRGPHACTVRTLQTELSTQPSSCFLTGRDIWAQQSSACLVSKHRHCQKKKLVPLKNSFGDFGFHQLFFFSVFLESEREHKEKPSSSAPSR